MLRSFLSGEGMETAGALWNWCWAGGRRNLAAFPVPTLLPHTESSLKSSCPVNSDFYSFNWSTKGFKSIKALWQHPRQEWESSRGTGAAASPDLQSGQCAKCCACTSCQPFKMLLFANPWSVSQLKMRSKSENSEIWLPKCQESCWLALPLYLWLMQDRAEDFNMQDLQMYGANTTVKKYHPGTAFSYPFPSFPLLLALFSKPRASEHIW